MCVCAGPVLSLGLVAQSQLLTLAQSLDPAVPVFFHVKEQVSAP